MEYKEGTYLKEFTEATAVKEGGASTVAGGCIAALTVAGPLFIVGLLLLLLLPFFVGVVCGLPFILIALFVAFTSVFKGREPAHTTVLTGECPYCGYDSIEVRETPGAAVTGADCPRCKMRVVIQGTRFVIPESQRKKLQLRG